MSGTNWSDCQSDRRIELTGLIMFLWWKIIHINRKLFVSAFVINGTRSVVVM